MYSRFLFAVGVCTLTASFLHAQNDVRRAVLRGSGRSDRGKCTIEVVVDRAADVEVRGDTAILHNLAGRPPQWRRFECSAVIPPRPANFHFSGVDGRGRQQLIRDPRDGGVAVVRIEDPKGGSEGYTFDLTWEGSGYLGTPDPYQVRRDDRIYSDDGGYRNDRGNVDRDDDTYHRDRDDWFRRENWRSRFFERIRQDVEHVQSITFPGTGDEHRVSRTLHELDELQGKLEAGRYDQGELDDVIAALQRVVHDNRLSPRDRDLLWDDLDRLREFRARHSDYGVR
jgi:hypothetical protein